MAPSPERITSPRTLALLWLAWGSGLALLVVLPLGMDSVTNYFIPIFSAAHLGLLLIAVTLGLFAFGRMAGLSRWPSILSWGGVVVVCAAAAALGAGPITDPAALNLHLAVPKWWVEAGAISPYLWCDAALHPTLMGLAFLEFINNQIVHFIPWYLLLYLLLLGAITARFVENRMHRHEAACLAFILTVTLPVALRSVLAPSPHLPLALFASVAIVALVAWLEDRQRRSLCILAGGALGLAAGCAVEGALAAGALIPALYIAARSGGIGRFRAVRGCCLVGATALVFYAPWAVRNGLWISNPFFPLGSDLLGSSSLLPSDRTQLDFAGRFAIAAANWREIFILPIEAIFFSRDGSAGRLDGTLTPLLLLGVAPLWSYRRHSWIVLSLWFGLFYTLTLWFCGITPLDRLLPLILPGIALTMLGLGQLSQCFKRRYERRVFTFLILAHGICTALYLGGKAAEMGALDRLKSGAFSVDYLRKHLPVYRTIEAVNRTVPPGAYIYTLLAGDGFYYYTPRVITGGAGKIGHLREWIRASHASRLPSSEFLNRGISFVVMDRVVVERALERDLSPEHLAVWRSFVEEHLPEIERVGSVSIHRVAP